MFLQLSANSTKLMVLIKDGSSEHVAHVLSKAGNLIGFRNLFTSTTVWNLTFFHLLHMCATCSELLFNLNMTKNCFPQVQPGAVMKGTFLFCFRFLCAICDIRTIFGLSTYKIVILHLLFYPSIFKLVSSKQISSSEELLLFILHIKSRVWW